MNIFILDKDIQKSARYLTNRHSVKMILEQSQILCSVHHFYESENVPYRKTHINHPCTIWTRTSLSNYKWLIDYTQAMIHEYKYRYDKIHACQKVLDWCKENIPRNIPDIGLTEFAQAMPEQYRNKDVVKAYRSYYIGEKSHLFEWKKRNKPRWIK